MNNKRTIMILILVLFIGIIGLTVAYFANSTDIDNIFQTKPYGSTVEETFTSPSNWLPGSEITKEITATNTGEVDQAVRISLTEGWTSSNSGSTLNGWIHPDGTKSTHTSSEELENDERVAIINFDNLSDWTYSNGYYYYNYKLSPNETTSSLIKSVTFNPNTKLDDTCVSTQTATGQTITCNSSGSDYDNATYTLTFNVETVQYNKYQEAWSTDVAISETKQRMLKGLKVNNSDAVFATGDKTALFEFSHPTTEQTPALTDYRYIGHIPNNYVKFNCDNDGTNCEIWRIIGVFDVDDGYGNYEQRIKLVRELSIQNIQWSEDIDKWGLGKDDWYGSKINSFLNNDYLLKEGDASSYGLKNTAQNLIDDALFYLGSMIGNDYFIENLYSIERGNQLCGACENDETKLSWLGKVALLYASDYGYTYSKGVENECYNFLTQCYYFEGVGTSPGTYNHPETGWMYTENSYWVLLADHDPYEASNYISTMGNLTGTGAENSYAVRPVVYLKSSINIISGEGTEQNPYTLSNP